MQWPDKLLLIGDEEWENEGVPSLWKQLLCDLSWVAKLSEGTLPTPPVSVSAGPLLERLMADWRACLEDMLEGGGCPHPFLVEAARNTPRILVGKVDFAVVRSTQQFDDAKTIAEAAASTNAIVWLDLKLGTDESQSLFAHQARVFHSSKPAAGSPEASLFRELKKLHGDLLGGATVLLAFRPLLAHTPPPLKMVAFATTKNPEGAESLTRVGSKVGVVTRPGSSVLETLNQWCKQAQALDRTLEDRLWPGSAADWFRDNDAPPEGQTKECLSYHDWEPAVASKTLETTTAALKGYLDDVMGGNCPAAWLEESSLAGLWEVLKGLVGAGSGIQGRGDHKISFPGLAFLAAAAAIECSPERARPVLTPIDWAVFRKPASRDTKKVLPVAAMPNQTREFAGQCARKVVQFWKTLFRSEGGEFQLERIEVARAAVRVTLATDASGLLDKFRAAEYGVASLKVWDFIRMTGSSDAGALAFFDPHIHLSLLAKEGQMVIELKKPEFLDPRYPTIRPKGEAI
jgi:hypothetical protein